MADRTPSLFVSSVSLGVTVIGLYIVFVLFVTIGFGSYIYRTAWQAEPISAATPDTQPLAADIDNLLFIIKREQDLERAKTLVSEDIQIHAAAMSDIETRHSKSFGTIAVAKRALRAEVDATLGKLSEYQYDLAGPQRLIYDTTLENLYLTVAAEEVNLRATTANLQLRALLRTLGDGLGDSDVDLDTTDRYASFHDDAIAKLDLLSKDVDSANTASLGIKAEKEALQAQIDELRLRWTAHDEQILALQNTLGPGDPARARLSALSLNFPIFPDILMRFVSFPTIFLTLIVTIAAGGLGTVVAFSRRYYSAKNADELTLSRLFVNVGEGIAAAIAIFLFSGAGMLALTQGSGPANDVELSPYTVAFIAFLSGFMAEDAFASIQSAGKRIFKPDPPAEKDGQTTDDSAQPEQA
ncbi:keratin [Tateyamaria omphalii]|uniref:keratin n=1 Tax=Tateyamaria omphalii TaxID=299262 RepID=UPI001C99314A|nr:keratin [Tateyamaria omphalii]MBY5932369.1 keratin [Tateyamaria omphalii]